MTGHEYEHHVARYLTKHGYSDVSVTQASGDYGIDVLAKKHGLKYAIQCKYYKGSVGPSAVQEAVAGKAMYHCDKAMVVTNSYFTKSAKELARANDVILKDNISGISSGLLSSKIRVILILVYLFFATAIAYATWETIREQSFGSAVYNILCTAIVLTFPFGIKPLCRFIFSLIKRTFASVCESIKSKKTKNESNDIFVVQDITEQPQKALEPKLFAHPGKIGNILADSDFSYITNYEKLCLYEYLSTSRVQRTLRLGYASAARLLDLLESAGLIVTSEYPQYKWTNKAK